MGKPKGRLGIRTIQRVNIDPSFFSSNPPPPFLASRFVLRQAPLDLPERSVPLVCCANNVALARGPRICLGQQFALTEASYVTVRLLQRYEEILNKDLETKIRHNLTLTTCSANGVKVCLKVADKS